MSAESPRNACQGLWGLDGGTPPPLARCFTCLRHGVREWAGMPAHKHPQPLSLSSRAGGQSCSTPWRQAQPRNFSGQTHAGRSDVCPFQIKTWWASERFLASPPLPTPASGDVPDGRSSPSPSLEVRKKQSGAPWWHTRDMQDECDSRSCYLSEYNLQCPDGNRWAENKHALPLKIPQFLLVPLPGIKHLQLFLSLVISSAPSFTCPLQSGALPKWPSTALAMEAWWPRVCWDERLLDLQLCLLTGDPVEGFLSVPFVRFLFGCSKQEGMEIFPRLQHLKSFLCCGKCDNKDGNGFVTKFPGIYYCHPHYHHHHQRHHHYYRCL